MPFYSTSNGYKKRNEKFSSEREREHTRELPTLEKGFIIQ